MPSVFKRIRQSLYRRITAMMLVFLALVFIGSGLVTWSFYGTVSRYQTDIEIADHKQELVDAIAQHANQIIFRARAYYIFLNAKEYDELFNEKLLLEQSIADFNRLSLSPEEKDLADSVGNFFKTYFSESFPKAAALAEKNDYAALRTYQSNGVITEVERMLEYAEDYKHRSNAANKAQNKELMNSLSSQAIIFFAFIGGVLLVSLVVIQRMAKDAGAPLSRLTEAADKVAQGEFIDIEPLARDDEIGRLSRSFQYMVVQINSKEEELLAQNEELQAQQAELQMQQDELQQAIVKMEQNERYLERRNRLILSLSNTLDKQELLTSIIKTTVEVSETDKGLIVLLNNERDYAAFGISERMAKQGVASLEDSLLARVIETRLPYVLERSCNSAEQGYHEESYRSYDLFVPILNGQDTAIACLILTRVGRPITKQEETEMAGMARQISLSFEKLDMFEASEKQRLLTQNILNTIQEGVHLIDIEGGSVQFNRMMADLWGLSDDAGLTGVSFDAFESHLSERVKDSVALQHFIKDRIHERGGKNASNAKSMIYEISGASPRIIRVYHEPLYWGTERFGTLFVHRDITSEYEVDQMKSEFVSTVSHELRTPLASVLGFTELLLYKELKPERQRKYLSTIHQEAQRLTGLINDFLDLQRMESGKQNYVFQEVDLLPIVENVIELQNVNASLHRFEIVRQTDKSVVWGDPDKIRQVFTNMVGNAVKYSPNGGLVQIVYKQSGDSLVIELSDEGLGIPEDALSKLFSKFYRIDNSDRREIGGTGLGLAIVKEIMLAHQGEIAVASEYGRGSTFSLRFPLPRMQEPSHSLSDDSRAGDIRVLIIEDDYHLSELLKVELEEQGFHVFSYANGEEALQQMEQIRPDIVVVDIILKNSIDGWTIVSELKRDERYSRIPIFISSAFEEKEKGAELGAQGYLIKPYQPHLLSEAIFQTFRDFKKAGRQD
ncbi:ATP-binding protein [Paenibacillus contaminans]|uniref:histidine kinase n=1 Tax=Paenibacillus contaminans TaxID=450362 RepID=A0A329LYB4_9BACL|nr:ATP-binding protein [Paenibacillus contaminans]RAV12136.1 histidine kinase [Paenibacillus contaminans]